MRLLLLCFFPVSTTCIKIAPHATSLASVVSVNSREKPGKVMTGGEQSPLDFLKSLVGPFSPSERLVDFVKFMYGAHKIEEHVVYNLFV